MYIHTYIYLPRTSTTSTRPEAFDKICGEGHRWVEASVEIHSFLHGWDLRDLGLGFRFEASTFTVDIHLALPYIPYTPIVTIFGITLCIPCFACNGNLVVNATMVAASIIVVSSSSFH